MHPLKKTGAIFYDIVQRDNPRARTVWTTVLHIIYSHANVLNDLHSDMTSVM